MKILVSGGRGQLGQALRNQGARFEGSVVLLDRDELDITRREHWERAIRLHTPDFILNAAAYTAVDLAEIHPDQAFALNRDAAALSARIAAEHKLPFIHFSTDYVFDGTKSTPYLESDLPNPTSVYGRSKYEGEQQVLLEHPQAWVIRLSWLYSPYAKNFLNTMLHKFAANEAVRVVNDQVASPTCALTFADHLFQFCTAARAQDLQGGVYHYSQGGEASWFDFALAIRAAVGASSEVSPVPTSAYTSSVKRPAYSKLDATRFEAVINSSIPTWQAALRACLS
jgi:dTDP-4-dehydrorhamnose reductase